MIPTDFIHQRQTKSHGQKSAVLKIAMMHEESPQAKPSSRTVASRPACSHGLLDESMRIAVEAMMKLARGMKLVAVDNDIAISRLESRKEEQLMQLQTKLAVQETESLVSGMKIPVGMLTDVILRLGEDLRAVMRLRRINRFMKKMVDFSLVTPDYISQNYKVLSHEDVVKCTRFSPNNEPSYTFMDTCGIGKQSTEHERAIRDILNMVKQDYTIWCVILALVHKDSNVLPDNITAALMNMPNRLQHVIYIRTHVNLSGYNWTLHKLDDASKTVEWRVTNNRQQQHQHQHQQQRDQDRHEEQARKSIRLSDGSKSLYFKPGLAFAATHELFIKHPMDCTEACKKPYITMKTPSSGSAERNCVQTVVRLNTRELTEFHDLMGGVNAFFKCAEDVPLWKKNKVLKNAEDFISALRSGKHAKQLSHLELVLLGVLNRVHTTSAKRTPIISANNPAQKSMGTPRSFIQEPTGNNSSIHLQRHFNRELLSSKQNPVVPYRGGGGGGGGGVKRKLIEDSM